MNKRIGFIGCGNMAKAMINGIIKSGVVLSSNIIASGGHANSLKKIKEELKINVATTNKEVVENSDIIVLSVKPNVYEAVIKEIKDVVSDEKIIVTIAAGQSISNVERAFGKDVKIVRTMPNTPALVGEGMTGVCKNQLITDEELDMVCEILRGFGKAEVVDEKLIDVVVSTSGSSPAYVFMMIEAMADAAVYDGMPRDKAYKFAAQAVLGSAKMVLETNMHPGALKDMVCSPGGTTIQAVATLEEKGFRSAIIEAMKVCANKCSNM